MIFLIYRQFCVRIWILNSRDQKRDDPHLCTEEGLVQEAVSRGMTAENQASNGCYWMFACFGLAFIVYTALCFYPLFVYFAKLCFNYI